MILAVGLYMNIEDEKKVDVVDLIKCLHLTDPGNVAAAVANGFKGFSFMLADKNTKDMNKAYNDMMFSALEDHKADWVALIDLDELNLQELGSLFSSVFATDDFKESKSTVMGFPSKGLFLVNKDRLKELQENTGMDFARMKDDLRKEDVVN